MVVATATSGDVGRLARSVESSLSVAELSVDLGEADQGQELVHQHYASKPVDGQALFEVLACPLESTGEQMGNPQRVVAEVSRSLAAVLLADFNAASPDLESTRIRCTSSNGISTSSQM